MDHCRYTAAEELISDIYGVEADVFTIFDGLRPLTVVKPLGMEAVRRVMDNRHLRYKIAELAGDGRVHFHLSSDAMEAKTIVEDIEAYHAERTAA